MEKEVDLNNVRESKKIDLFSIYLILVFVVGIIVGFIGVLFVISLVPNEDVSLRYIACIVGAMVFGVFPFLVIAFQIFFRDQAIKKLRYPKIITIMLLMTWLALLFLNFSTYVFDTQVLICKHDKQIKIVRDIKGSGKRVFYLSYSWPILVEVLPLRFVVKNIVIQNKFSFDAILNLSEHSDQEILDFYKKARAMNLTLKEFLEQEVKKDIYLTSKSIKLDRKSHLKPYLKSNSNSN